MLKTITISLLTAIIALGSAWDTMAAPKKLKYAVFTPAKEPTFPGVMVPFAKDASKDSGGTIQIDTFPGGSLGKNPRSQLKLALDGVVDMSWIIPSYTPGRFPDNGVFELPGLFRNVHESANTVWRIYKKGMLRGFENVFVVSLFQNHPYYVFTKKKVSTLSDLKGLKIRAAGPVFGASIRAVGATPVGMPAPTIAENISRGIMDGSTLEFNGYYAFRIKDVAPHTLMSSTGTGLFGTASLATVMNKKIFDGLPEKARKSIMKHSGQVTTDNFVKVHDAGNVKLMNITNKNPALHLNRLSAAEQKKFDAKMAAVIDKWASKNDRRKKLLAAVRAEVRAIRAGK
jgi:TRAP-type C4-dicarboxylate transport system substrate-binding protein